MRRLAAAILLAALLVIAALPRAAAQGWVLVEKVGEWEKAEVDNFSTKMGSGYCEVKYVASNVTLGRYETTLDIDLRGTGVMRGEIEISIPELRFSVRYVEEYRPAMLGLGDRIRNELVIAVGGEEHRVVQEAAWPMQSRLNGRIYLWVWRSGNDTVSWVVSDGYMLSEGPASLYFAGNLSFRRSVTIELVVRKFVEGGEGALTAFLVYNKVDSSGEVYEDYRPATLDYGFNALFYATLAMFICTVVGHITARVLRKEAELRAARARRGWHKKG